MKKFKPVFRVALMALLVMGSVTPLSAQQGRRDEQDRVREGQRNGTLMKLREIEAIIVPAMQRRGARYIGAEFDAETMRYRLKFVRQSSVIWIDVDGRSGAIVAQAGN